MLQNKLKVRQHVESGPDGTLPIAISPTITQPYSPTQPLTNPPSQQERKYFDSGDYALSKAGKASDVGVTQIGREHPVPENIPHASASPHNQHNGSISASPGTIPGQNLAGALARGGSPVKEGSGLQRERSASDEDESDAFEEKGSEHAKSRPVVVEK